MPPSIKRTRTFSMVFARSDQMIVFTCVAAEIKKMRATQKEQLATKKASKSKAMFLKDYHRKTLLAGEIPGALDENDGGPVGLTHAEEVTMVQGDIKVRSPLHPVCYNRASESNREGVPRRLR